MKKIILLLAFIIVTSAFFALCVYGDGELNYAEFGPGGTVTNVDELILAFGTDSFGEPNAELLVGSKTEVRLRNSVIMQGTITIKEGSYTVVGSGCTVARSDDCGTVFALDGGSLIIERKTDESFDFGENSQPNITFDGQNKSGKSFITVSGKSNLTINAKVVVKNIISSENGAFIRAEGSDSVEIYSSRFENCKAKNGGVICFTKIGDGSNESLVVKKCSFNSSSAENGGAIYSDVKTVISNSDFEGNSASENGGAIFLGGNSELNTIEANENIAKKGGAVYNKGAAAIVVLSACNNISDFGGAVYNKNSCLISDVYFLENEAKSVGGAIYNEGAFYLNSGSIMGNIASECGGGVYCTKGSLFKIESGEITSSEAKYSSGMYCEGDLIMTGGAIGKNEGNAPHVAVFGKMEMSGSAVCYGGDIIGLIKDADGKAPAISLKSVLSNKDRQHVAFYVKTDNGFKRDNSSGDIVFEGAEDAISSAVKVFIVEDGGLFPHKISENGQIKLAFPTLFVIIILVVAVACTATLIIIKMKRTGKTGKSDTAEAVKKQ